MKIKSSILKRAAKIQLLILDVDGVLTNGKIYYNDNGTQAKAFYVPDGLGMKMLLRSGVAIAVISGKFSTATKNRLQELGVKHIYLGHENKTAVFAKLVKKLKIQHNAIAYVGDDIPDLPLMQRVGLSIAVKNAQPLVLKTATIVTKNCGGKGAIREICDLILQAQNNLTTQVEAYF